MDKTVNNEYKVHELLQKLFDRYKLPDIFRTIVVMQVEELFGGILFSFATSLVSKEALPDFEKMLEDSSITQEVKILTMYKLIEDYSTVDIDKLYNSFVTIFVFKIEKGIADLINLYNKAVAVSKTKEELQENFLSYLQAYDDLKTDKFAQILDKLNTNKDE